MKEEATVTNPEVTRRKLVDAAVRLMRLQGFSATTVDRVCAEAGVTKGAFFHYFPSKEAIGLAAVESWCQSRAEGYRADMKGAGEDPLEQLRCLLDGLADSVLDPPDGLTVCLLGMVSQEVASTRESLREACGSALGRWTGLVAGLLRAAKEIHPVRMDFDPEEIGWLLNSLWQGSLLVAKTRRDPEIVIHNFRHARAYIDSLFGDAEAFAKN